ERARSLYSLGRRYGRPSSVDSVRPLIFHSVFNPAGTCAGNNKEKQMTTTKKQQPIKAVKNFRRMTAELVVTTAHAIQVHFDPANNPNLAGAPPLPVDMATLKAATDLLSAKITAAAEGGKTAVAEKNHQKEAVVKLLIQLAQYAEANCKDEMATFISFGFEAAASTKAKAAPVSESFRKIASGPNSGEMSITLMRFVGAVSYLVQ